MSTTERPHSRIGATTQNRLLLRGAVVGAAVATLVNAALWAGGRVADVSFFVTLPLGDTTIQVGIVEVVLTTLLTFAIGAALLALGARRSHRWVRAVLVAAALVAVVSAGAPATAAHNTATGILLVAMHLVAGGTFLVTGSLVATRPALTRDVPRSHADHD